MEANTFAIFKVFQSTRSKFKWKPILQEKSPNLRRSELDDKLVALPGQGYDPDPHEPVDPQLVQVDQDARRVDTYRHFYAVDILPSTEINWSIPHQCTNEVNLVHSS